MNFLVLIFTVQRMPVLRQLGLDYMRAAQGGESGRSYPSVGPYNYPVTGNCVQAYNVI